MQTINPLSTTLKLKILVSVLFTVLKFLFSLVRKYFWFRLIVDKSRDSFIIDSSSADVCSGGVPFLEGKRAEGPSPSTCEMGTSVSHHLKFLCNHGKEFTYSYFEVDHLVGVRAHFIVKAEFVFTNVLRSEDRVNLSLFAIFHDDVVVRAPDWVVNIERTARLNLILVNKQVAFCKQNLE